MNKQVEGSLKVAITSLQLILTQAPKTFKTKKVDHVVVVQSIKDNLAQAQVSFMEAGLPNSSSATKLLLDEVEKASENVKVGHGMDYARLRKYVNQLLPQVFPREVSSTLH